ncbi:DsbE family thiol:disulfide interchange protein [Vibrio intestinalis]|uniref:DsbE family thiol:disulfide interchange protein n=1 Tax=Vibrio intestinalis TaxID=2933291 RepID=UPI0021A2BCBE|nr:DsbE family thiol:disulfide interchange protein [Vibrio intestinalis]
MKKIVLVLVMTAIFSAVLVVGVRHGNLGPQLSASTQRLPAIDVRELLSPQTRPLQDLIQHDMQLVNVWASWCGYCRAEHGFIEELNEQGVPIIGVNYRDKRASAIHFLNQMGNPFQHVIYDPRGELSDQLSVTVVPVTFLVNKQGEIIYKHVGQLDAKSWQARFAEYFDE